MHYAAENYKRSEGSVKRPFSVSKKKLKEQALRLLRYGKNTPITGQSQAAPTITDRTLSNICSSIKELTLDKYVACATSDNEDYGSLIINQTDAHLHSPDDLKKAWLRIQSDYYQVRGDSQTAQYVELANTIEGKRFRLFFLQMLINMLWERYDADICEGIKALGYEEFELSFETYKDDIKSIVNSEKMNVFEIEEAQKELTEMTEGQHGEVKKATYEDYYNGLLNIIEHTKVPYRMNEITVYEFALQSKRLQKNNELMQARYAK